MIKNFTFIFSFILVERNTTKLVTRIYRSFSDTSSSLLFLNEQVPCLFVNLVPPMDVSLMNYMEDLPSPVKSWAGK